MVQDSITDHIFDRPHFFVISSYRVMSDINGKLFSFSIGWWHSFDCIRSWIQINPNKMLIGLQPNGHAVLSNQRCHDVTVLTVFQRNSTDLASARTPTHVKPHNWRTTDVQISKKDSSWSCMCTGQVCAEHRHLHFSFVAATRAPAWASHQRGQAAYGNEHLALAKTYVLGYTHRRRKGRGLVGATEK